MMLYEGHDCESNTALKAVSKIKKVETFIKEVSAFFYMWVFQIVLAIFRLI